MKIAYISDTHHEFASQTEQATLNQDVDVLVLAGDIDQAKRVPDRALSIANGHAKNVVFVFGNHEYYGERMDKARRQCCERLETIDTNGVNLYFLDNGSVEIDGFTFIGATLWTNYQLYGNQPLAMMEAEWGLNDFRRITIFKNGSYRKINAKDILSENVISEQFIFSKLADQREKGLLEKTIVVTHHGPDGSCIDPEFLGSPLNPAYASNYGNRIAYEGGPKLWISGHMHVPDDHMIGDTRHLRNPYGYPGQLPDRGIKYLEV
jgi:predicted phosphodiesterase